MEAPSSDEKLGQENDVVYASSSTGDVEQHQNTTWAYLKHYFTSREGWIGDYVRSYHSFLLLAKIAGH